LQPKPFLRRPSIFPFSPSWQQAAPLSEVTSPPSRQTGPKGGDFLDKEQEKWAIFWCDLLSPIIYGEIEPEATNWFLKQKALEQFRYPDGGIGTPSISTLRRKLKRYQEGGFN